MDQSEQLPEWNKASYKLIKDFPNDLVKHPQYHLVSDTHQYSSASLCTWKTETKISNLAIFLLLLFTYFDFLAALIILNAQQSSEGIENRTKNKSGREKL